MTIDNIRIKDTFRSAIAIESVDGAEIENVQVSNVHAVNTEMPFLFVWVTVRVSNRGICGM